MPVDNDEFRTTLSRFASGVTIVTTRDTDGHPYGMTVSAFCSLSLEPPLVLICIDKKAFSHQALEHSGAFAVNILAEDQELTSRRFASPESDRFEGIAYRTGIADVPVLEHSLASLECRLTQTHDGGDHTIFVGAVEAVTFHDGTPLVYFKGGYARLTL